MNITKTIVLLGMVTLYTVGATFWGDAKDVQLIHRKGNFSFSINRPVTDVTYIDKVVKTSSGHTQGYIATFSGDTDEVVLLVTRRDNKPEGKVSQKRWNTTWYDKPISTLSKREYIDTWRSHTPSLQLKDVDGSFYGYPKADSARWSKVQSQSKDHNGGVDYVIEKIMQFDPTHRYVFSAAYMRKYAEDWDQVMRNFQKNDWHIGGYPWKNMKWQELKESEEFLEGRTQGRTDQGERKKEGSDYFKGLGMYGVQTYRIEKTSPNAVHLTNGTRTIDVEVYPVSLTGSLFQDGQVRVQDVKELEDLYKKQLAEQYENIQFKEGPMYVNDGFVYESFWGNDSLYYVGITPNGKALFSQAKGLKEGEVLFFEEL